MQRKRDEPKKKKLKKTHHILHNEYPNDAVMLFVDSLVFLLFVRE